jgi:hypothetical protein
MRTQKEQQKRMFILKKNNKVSLFAWQFVGLFVPFKEMNK